MSGVWGSHLASGMEQQEMREGGACVGMLFKGIKEIGGRGGLRAVVEFVAWNDDMEFLRSTAGRECGCWRFCMFPCWRLGGREIRAGMALL